MADYLSALWIHWVALMSGVVSLVLGIGLRVGRRVSSKVRGWTDIPDWIFVIVGALCLFFAGYQAWMRIYHWYNSSTDSTCLSFRAT
jgi:hypothetical protein